MSYTDNKLISLNSNYGTQINGSLLSNVVFNFKGLLKRDDDILYSSISVLNAQIPCSFYIVNATNNVIKITQLGTTYTFTIPQGNYNANTLITQMLTTITLTITSIIINSSTGKLTFTFPTSATILASSSMSSIIGMNTTNISGLSIVMPFPLNLLGAKRLSIKSNYLSIDSYHSFNNGSTTTLATIPIDQASFNMISYINYNSTSYILKCKNIDTIDIQIYDEFNNLFDFNNTDWSITLLLSVVRNQIIQNNADLITSLLEHNKQIKENITTDLKPQKELSLDEKELELLQK